MPPFWSGSKFYLPLGFVPYPRHGGLAARVHFLSPRADDLPDREPIVRRQWINSTCQDSPVQWRRLWGPEAVSLVLGP